MPRHRALLRPGLSFPTSSSRCSEDRLPTGVQVLDQLLEGGLPRGTLVEIVGDGSSGKTSLLFSILAQATSRGEMVAYLDVFNAFDPAFARRVGVELGRLLWIRCRDLTAEQRVAKALKAADILARSEGFGVVAMDLEDNPGSNPRALDRIPFKHWFRLKRIIRGQSLTFILLGSRTRSGSAASVALGLEWLATRWRTPTIEKNRKQGRLVGSSDAFPPPEARHNCLLGGISSQAGLLRGKRHGHVKIHCSF